MPSSLLLCATPQKECTTSSNWRNKTNSSWFMMNAWKDFIPAHNKFWTINYWKRKTIPSRTVAMSGKIHDFCYNFFHLTSLHQYYDIWSYSESRCFLDAHSTIVFESCVGNSPLLLFLCDKIDHVAAHPCRYTEHHKVVYWFLGNLKNQLSAMVFL